MLRRRPVLLSIAVARTIFLRFWRSRGRARLPLGKDLLALLSSMRCFESLEFRVGFAEFGLEIFEFESLREDCFFPENNQ